MAGVLEIIVLIMSILISLFFVIIFVVAVIWIVFQIYLKKIKKEIPKDMNKRIEDYNKEYKGVKNARGIKREKANKLRKAEARKSYAKTGVSHSVDKNKDGKRKRIPLSNTPARGSKARGDAKANKAAKLHKPTDI